MLKTVEKVLLLQELEVFREARATIRRCVNSIGGEYPSGLI